MPALPATLAVLPAPSRMPLIRSFPLTPAIPPCPGGPGRRIIDHPARKAGDLERVGKTLDDLGWVVGRGRSGLSRPAHPTILLPFSPVAGLPGEGSRTGECASTSLTGSWRCSRARA